MTHHLNDFDAAVVRAVEKHNCRHLFNLNVERVQHFAQRVVERELTPADVVIVLLNVDDKHGGTIADLLMPGHDWQSYRDRGETPVARGLAARDGITETIAVIDLEAAEKLRAFVGLAVVVVDCGVAEVFPAEDSR